MSGAETKKMTDQSNSGYPSRIVDEHAVNIFMKKMVPKGYYPQGARMQLMTWGTFHGPINMDDIMMQAHIAAAINTAAHVDMPGTFAYVGYLNSLQQVQTSSNMDFATVLTAIVGTRMKGFRPNTGAMPSVVSFTLSGSDNATVNPQGVRQTLDEMIADHMNNSVGVKKTGVTPK